MIKLEVHKYLKSSIKSYHSQIYNSYLLRFYKNKRWDLLFSNKLKLMLPSQNVTKSIKIYKKLLDSDILINKKIIDLRITNQIILTNYNE